MLSFSGFVGVFFNSGFTCDEGCWFPKSNDVYTASFIGLKTTVFESCFSWFLLEDFSCLRISLISEEAACTAFLVGPMTLIEALCEASLAATFSQDVPPAAQRKGRT